MRLKATGEEGVVLAILDQDMVEVEVEETRFPVFVDALEHPYLHWFTEKSKKKERKEEKSSQDPPVLSAYSWARSDRERQPAGIHLALLPEFSHDPEEEQVEALKVFLVHHLDHPCVFEYSMEGPPGLGFQLKGRLEPGAHLYLHRFALDHLNEQPRFRWGLQSAGPGKWTQESGKIRIKPKALFDHFHAMEQGEDPLMILPMIKQWRPWVPLKPVPLKKPARSVSPSPKKRKSPGVPSRETPPSYELDLHIEAILPHHRGMQASEMLQIQTEVLEREVYRAIAAGADRMVIIHGLGKGVLRSQVHEFLGGLDEVLSFQNEWHPRYGFGATEVRFRSSFGKS